MHDVHDQFQNEKALIAEANSLLNTPLFDQESSRVREDFLPFYSEASLISIQALDSIPPFTLEFVRTQERIVKLDGTMEAFHNVHRIEPPILTSENAIAYVKFVLSRLYTEGDSFKLIEHRFDFGFTGQIHLLGLILLRLRLFRPRVEEYADGFRITAPVLYLDHLYRAVIQVDPDGEIYIVDEKMLLRKVPSRDIWLE